MRFLALLPLFLLVAWCSGAPATPSDNLVLTNKFFKDSYVKYTADHDIVNLVVPLNKLNFDDDDESSSEEDGVTLFFVQADINDKGEKDYKGLYIYQNGKASALLANGRCAAALNDDSKKVFIGASDGLFVYDGEEKGSVNQISLISDSIIQVEVDNQTGIVYYLTENHDLYSVNDEGVKTKVETVKNAREFVLDFLSNIYFYDANNDLYVFNAEGLKKFELSTPSSIKLIRPMFAQDEGVLAIIDDYLYVLYPSGKAEKGKLKLEVKPTAYAPEATLLQYYALNKKIYEFNVLEMLFASEIPELQSFLNEKENEIKTIATRSRGSF